jgi:hypothetical protein
MIENERWKQQQTETARPQMKKRIALLLLIAVSSSFSYAKDKKEKANKNWIDEKDTVMFEVQGKGEATKQEVGGPGLTVGYHPVDIRTAWMKVTDGRIVYKLECEVSKSDDFFPGAHPCFNGMEIGQKFQGWKTEHSIGRVFPDSKHPDKIARRPGFVITEQSKAETK